MSFKEVAKKRSFAELAENGQKKPEKTRFFPFFPIP